MMERRGRTMDRIKHCPILGLVVLAFGVLGLGPSRSVAADIAILDSHRTRAYFEIFYNQCDLNTQDPNAMGPLEYKRYWGGWEYVLQEMTAADAIGGYDVVNDDFITRGLARSGYKVLILSNNVALSSSQMDAIKKWVASGGHLLASFGTGYEAEVESPEDIDFSKPKKNELQVLWQDPSSKLVTTGSLGMVPPEPGSYPPGSVEPMITRLEGPTAKICEYYDPAGGICPWYFYEYRLLTGYGDLANMLVGRSVNHPGVYAHFAFANNLAIFDPNDIWPDTEYDKPLPAIVASAYRKGLAVYYAFAPGFIVGLEYDVSGHCATDPNYPVEPEAAGLQNDLTWANNHWAGRTPDLRALMKSTIDYLLNTP